MPSFWISLIWTLSLTILPFRSFAEPEATNIRAAQREGTKLVDIYYSLAGVDGVDVPATIAMEISDDGGVSYAVTAVSLSGDVGGGVEGGPNRHIVWDAGADWTGRVSDLVKFRLSAQPDLCGGGDGGNPRTPAAGFSLIPGGSFTMGRTSGDEDPDAPQVTVTVSPFYIQQSETTKAEWDEVRTWALAHSSPYTDLTLGAGKASSHPVGSLSWWDVVKWCNARSEKEGLKPCYFTGPEKRHDQILRTGSVVKLTVCWSANGYRLPTEAEWEKAARGGVSGKRFPWGTDTISHANANFRNEGEEAYQSGTQFYHPTYGIGELPWTSPVGSFAPNGFGLFDMSGNVWEWCWDWYDVYNNGTTDPRGPETFPTSNPLLNVKVRVVRGGGWNDGRAFYSRVAMRGVVQPEYRRVFAVLCGNGGKSRLKEA